MEMVENLKAEKIKINGIPSMLWGKKSNKIFIAVHGNMSNKEDEVIKILAQKVISKGYQLLSFDLPEHGERKEDKTYLCKVQNCVRDLSDIMAYAKEKYDEINLWACSMGAYFSLLAYKNQTLCLLDYPSLYICLYIHSHKHYHTKPYCLLFHLFFLQNPPRYFD